MSKNTSFSIIVPTYNTYEKYLRECLNSLVYLEYDNFEIIIIDDGSNKKTREILEEYNKYDFLRIIHQNNKGITASRINGVLNAKNDYICFVDSDDIMRIDFLNILSDIILAENPDFVLHSPARFYDCINNIKEPRHLFNKGTVDKKNVIKEIVSLHMNGVVNVCSKRSLFKNMSKNVDFSIINGDDLQQTSYLASISNSFYYTDQIIYYYRFNKKTKEYYDVRNINDINFLLPTYNLFFKNNKEYANLLPIYKKSAVNAVLYIAFQVCWLNISKKEKYKYLNELNSQKIVKVLTSIKCQINLSEILFKLLINKNYFIINIASKLFKLVY